LTALQQLDASAFTRYLAIFGVLATIYVVITLVEYYVQQRLVIRWWSWLTDHIVDDWLGDTAYHRGRFTRAPSTTRTSASGGHRLVPGDDGDARRGCRQRIGVAGVVHDHPVAAVRAARPARH
jgi:hypothetical protein